jgi:hypothetical protein
MNSHKSEIEEHKDPTHLINLSRFWQRYGCRVRLSTERVCPSEHDRLPASQIGDARHGGGSMIVVGRKALQGVGGCPRKLRRDSRLRISEALAEFEACSPPCRLGQHRAEVRPLVESAGPTNACMSRRLSHEIIKRCRFRMHILSSNM